MNRDKLKEWLKFVLVFAGLYMVTGVLLGIFTQQIIGLSSGNGYEALEFYQVYPALEGRAIMAELTQGLLLAAVIYPLWQYLKEKKHGKLMLLGVLWGVQLIGSVEPVPGSFEGLIYTRTTLWEHFLIIATGLLRIAILAAFMTSDQTKDHARETESFRPSSTFIRRFTVLHVITYFVAGVLFYQLQNYQQSINEMEIFGMWRDLEDPVTAMMIFLGSTFGQVFRGAWLAFFLTPFQKLFQAKKGWILLFTTMWGLTFLTATGIMPWFAETLAGERSVYELLVGFPEVTVQMLVFSMLLQQWELRKPRLLPSQPTEAENPV